MHPIDWTIIGLYLVWIVWDGLRLAKGTDRIDGYFLASRSLPWWAVGLSVMATQLSAITMIGTTGQGYAVGMSLLQQYYALPIAMIILAVTFVPFFHGANIYTAYEYLERRFDAKTRAFTAGLFLLSRGMSTGVVISAPAVVLSVMIGLDVTTTCLLFGIPTAIYTMFGGVQAVAWTDVKQMYLIVFGLVAAVVALILGLPDGVSAGDALAIAGSTGRLQVFNFSLDPSVNYTFWTGTIGALFLFLSYFGTDQSQVQRYLTAKSVDEARTSLFMSAYWKIPLQALVLVIGVLMFVFYLFTPPPMLFNPVHDQQMRQGARAAEYQGLEQKFGEALSSRRAAAEQMAAARRSGDAAAVDASAEAFNAEEQRVKSVRAEAVTLVRAASGDANYNDVNYVFPTFVVTHLPVGLIGLLMAAIFAAAMSTIAGELSALSTRQRDGHLSPLGAGRWGRDTPAVGVEADDALLGGVRVDRGHLGLGAGIAHRGGEPLRVVLLRIHPRRVPAGHRLEARQRHRRLRGPHRGNGHRGLLRAVHQGGLPLAQPDRRRRGVRRGRRRQRPRAFKTLTTKNTKDTKPTRHFRWRSHSPNVHDTTITAMTPSMRDSSGRAMSWTVSLRVLRDLRG